MCYWLLWRIQKQAALVDAAAVTISFPFHVLTPSRGRKWWQTGWVMSPAWLHLSFIQVFEQYLTSTRIHDQCSICEIWTMGSRSEICTKVKRTPSCHNLIFLYWVSDLGRISIKLTFVPTSHCLGDRNIWEAKRQGWTSLPGKNSQGWNSTGKLSRWWKCEPKHNLSKQGWWGRGVKTGCFAGSLERQGSEVFPFE